MPAERDGSVAGVLLAAGSASRFGLNKLLLELDGETLVARAARTALEAGLDPVVCVLGHEADRLRDRLSSFPLRFVINAAYAGGMNTSLAAGIAAVPEGAAAAVVLLADMPRVTSAMVGRLVETFRMTRAPIVASDYGGVQAPPTLYARALFSELGGADGEGSGKDVVMRHAREVVRVGWPAAALADVDRAEDLEGLSARAT